VSSYRSGGLAEPLPDDSERRTRQTGQEDPVVSWRYRLIGVLEDTNGVLLFGIRTAFLFAVTQTYLLVLFHPRGRGTDDEPAA
jgi:hypothetical protein